MAVDKPTVEITDEVIALKLQRGPEKELRVTTAKANGFPFVGLREWEKWADGDYHATKRGITIKTRELRHVVEALRDILGEGSE